MHKVHVSWKTALSMELELIFTLENIHYESLHVWEMYIYILDKLHVRISVYIVPHLYAEEFSDC